MKKTLQRMRFWIEKRHASVFDFECFKRFKFWFKFFYNALDFELKTLQLVGYGIKKSRHVRSKKNIFKISSFASFYSVKTTAFAFVFFSKKLDFG